MKWFSIAGIRAEIGRIRWPKTKDLAINSGKVIFFTVLFAVFFLLCEFVASAFLQAVGI